MINIVILRTYIKYYANKIGEDTLYKKYVNIFPYYARIYNGYYHN